MSETENLLEDLIELFNTTQQALIMECFTNNRFHSFPSLSLVYDFSLFYQDLKTKVETVATHMEGTDERDVMKLAWGLYQRQWIHNLTNSPDQWIDGDCLILSLLLYSRVKKKCSDPLRDLMEKRVRFTSSIVQRTLTSSEEHYAIIIFKDDDLQEPLALVDIGAHYERSIIISDQKEATTEMKHFTVSLTKLSGVLISQRQLTSENKVPSNIEDRFTPKSVIDTKITSYDLQSTENYDSFVKSSSAKISLAKLEIKKCNFERYEYYGGDTRTVVNFEDQSTLKSIPLNFCNQIKEMHQATKKFVDHYSQLTPATAPKK